MKTILNGEPTTRFGRPDENETIEDYLDRIGNQLADNNMAITEIKVDGEPFKDDFSDRKCRSIDELRLTVNTMEGLAINTIGQLGTYCHRFLDQVPGILDQWNELSDEEIETYREQVHQALDTFIEVFTSLKTVLNLEGMDELWDKRVDQAKQFRDEVRNSSYDELRKLFEKSVRSYIEETLQELQELLDRIETRRDRLTTNIQRGRELLDDVTDTVDSVVNEIKSADPVDEIFDLEMVSDTTSKLTEINQIVESLDQSGRLRSLFPSERHEDLKDLFLQLRDGISGFLSLQERENPSEMIEYLRSNLKPTLEQSREIFYTLELSDEDVDLNNRN